MKTMKYLNMAALALLGIMIVGCSNDDDKVETQPEETNNVVILKTTVNLDGEAEQTRSITTTGMKYYLAGDQMVLIYKKKDGTTAKSVSDPLTNEDIHDRLSATFTFAVSNAQPNGAIKYIYPASMAKETIATDATVSDDEATINFSALDDQGAGTMASLNADGYDLSTYDGFMTDIATLPAVVSTDNKLAICKFTDIHMDGGSGNIRDKITKMAVTDGTYTYKVAREALNFEFYVVMRPVTSDKIITVTATAEFPYAATGKVEKLVKEVSGKALNAGSVYPITLNMNSIKFRVTSGFVYFSPGNLQYKASTGTWRFAEHQWDYIGADNANISSTYDGWIDLFGWGTSGYHNDGDANNLYYLPYSHSDAETGNDLNVYGYGPSKDQTDKNLTETSANYDWGVYNAIGSDPAGTWRTLTHNEWSYMLYDRSASTVNGTENARFAFATLCGTVNGLIIFPDTYIHPSGVAQPVEINVKSPSGAAWPNEYSASDWAKMETHGAAFLPAAGYRRGSDLYKVQTDGRYWTTDYYTIHNGWSQAFEFYSYGTNNGGVSIGSPETYMGCSVRLVHN